MCILYYNYKEIFKQEFINLQSSALEWLLNADNSVGRVSPRRLSVIHKPVGFGCLHLLYTEETYKS